MGKEEILETKDENTSYLVSKAEFKENNKNPFIAGILSISLGILGVHRFYLKRKLSGFIFLILSISSLGPGNGSVAAIIMLISLIEGIVYIARGITLLKEKIDTWKSKYIEKLDEPAKNKNTSKVNEVSKVKEIKEVKEIEIIEVSDINPTKIPHTNKFNFNKTDWIKKLKLPYERNVAEVEQVKEETLKLYERLCNFIDEQLRNNNSSLNTEVRKRESEGGYYNNILSPPKEDTKIYFNLTESGQPRKWWDTDGELRANREFSNKELNILKATPPRNTVVWDIQGVNKQIIALYLEIWQIISNGLTKDLKWKKTKKKILENILDGKYMYFSDYQNGRILSSLLKLAENTVREIMPNTQVLNISNEQDNIERNLPKEIVDDINNKLIEFKEGITDQDLKEILSDMIKKNPDDWKLKVEEILMCGTDKGINALIEFKEDKDFIKIAKDIIKKADDENLLLLCLYGIGIEERLSQKNAKLLKDMIHPSNISAYEKILKSKEVLSLELLNKLVELKNPLRKKIELDMDKVKISKKELDETVEIVKEYIGNEEDKEESQKKEVKEEVLEAENNEKIGLKYGEFINLMLDVGAIELEEGKKLAMENGTLLNAFISDINRELYEYIEDQTVVIEDEYIKIDDFYVDMVKELVTSEE